MTAEEFVIWFKGFAQAANAYNITPKQWEDVKDKLETVEDTKEYDFEDEEIYYDYATVTTPDWYVDLTSGSFDIKYYNHT
jgi:hypothetical protein